mmetsp:Transcript_59729/g.124804  ORF Transcript_59729/g.124804 Transcript_59729/m.124804 type:complete len:224 (+) Transcript_59729:346-1017(+)
MVRGGPRAAVPRRARRLAVGRGAPPRVGPVQHRAAGLLRQWRRSGGGARGAWDGAPLPPPARPGCCGATAVPAPARAGRVVNRGSSPRRPGLPGRPGPSRLVGASAPRPQLLPLSLSLSLSLSPFLSLSLWGDGDRGRQAMTQQCWFSSTCVYQSEVARMSCTRLMPSTPLTSCMTARTSASFGACPSLRSVRYSFSCSNSSIWLWSVSYLSNISWILARFLT